MQANGRFQRWNSKGSQQGLVEAAATDLKHFRRFRGLEPGKLERLIRTEGYVQANGRFQRWNSKGSQQGLVKAAATDLKHFRRFRGLEPGKRQA